MMGVSHRKCGATVLTSLFFIVVIICTTTFANPSAEPEQAPPVDSDPNPNDAYEQDFAKEFTEFCLTQEIGRNTPEKINKDECKRIKEIEFHDDDLHMLFMVVLVILFGATVRSILKYLHISLPYTVIIMASGMAVGFAAKYFCYELYTFTAVARLNSKVILFTFLPVLIFESSFSIPGHVFMKACGQVLILAAPGMLFCTFLTAFICHTFFASYSWTFMEAIFFGCIISATDPVAVVAILKELGVSETLGVLVDGESLLNDGIAILLYEVIKELLVLEEEKVHMETGDIILHVVGEFFQIAVGGPAFGYVMGKITIFALSRIFNDAVVEITITLVSAYLTYYIGEDVLHVSGVMAVVLLGITMSAEKTCISPDTEHEVHDFWGMLGFLANTVLFFITGVIITERGTRNLDWDDLYYLILLYFGLNLIRFLMLLALGPILTRIGYGLTWQNAVVLMWGGLRGAVGTCLSLEVYEDPEFCKKKLGPKVLIQTAGIVLLTLVINGTTTKKLLKILKLTEISPGRMEEMTNALKVINARQKKSLVMLRHDRFLADANWTYVAEHTRIENPYRHAHVASSKTADQTSIVSLGPEQIMNQCPACHTMVPNQPTNDELKAMTEEARLRVIKAMKISFWAHFERGVLTEEAVLILASTAEAVADRPLYMIHAKDLKKYWTIRGIFPWLRERMVQHVGEDTTEAIPDPPKQKWRRGFWWIATRDWFEFAVAPFVILNTISMIVEMTMDARNQICGPQADPIYGQLFMGINIFFALMYIVEFLIKRIGRGFMDYWSSRWNWLDFAVLIVSILDVVLGFLVGCTIASTMNKSPALLSFFKILRILRVGRCLKLLRPLIPAVMNMINGKINTQLFLGYDVALGFIVACDDVVKFLPQMIDNKKVLMKIRASVEKERMETVREMGILQKKHPGIAIAVKTRHASRSVLNKMKATLSELRVDGLLDEKENDLLTIVLEERMKRLWNSPSYIAPPSPEVLLENLNWVFGNNELRDYIFNNATLLQYEANDVIVGNDDPPCGIYVIVAGMVKIHYEPNPEVIEGQRKFGCVPIMEIFKDVDFDKRTEDFFSTGTVIGESACLTGRNRCAAVTCETEGVTAYHIPYSVMIEALETFDDEYNSLEVRLWRSCGMRRGLCLLPNLPSYHNVPKEKLGMLLERSCVPIGPEFDQIKIPPYVNDVIVIEGMVQNVDNKEVYVAPTVIPKTCMEFRMLPNERTVNRVLLVLGEHSHPDDDDDSGIARCFQAARELRRQSILEDNNIMITKPSQGTLPSLAKDKQGRYSVAVSFGVRPRKKRSSIYMPLDNQESGPGKDRQQGKPPGDGGKR